MQRWGLFEAMVFLLLGVTLAYLEAGLVAEHGALARYAFWMATAAATFLAWWLSQWWVVSGRERLTPGLLLASCLVPTLLFVPASLLIDAVFDMSDTAGAWWPSLIEEWAVSAMPIFAASMIASLPAWLPMNEAAPLAQVPAPEPLDEPMPTAASAHAPAAGPAAEPAAEPVPAVSAVTAEPPESTLLPSALRGGVLHATADLHYVHLHSPKGMTTLPGPMHRAIELLGERGIEVRRGEGTADRHVKQVKCVRGLCHAAEGRPAGRGEPPSLGRGQRALGIDALRVNRIDDLQ